MKKLRIYISLTLNYVIDYYLYIKYSSTFFQNTQDKILARISYNYHLVEKGLSMTSMRYKFGKQKIKDLLSNTLAYVNSDYDKTQSQFISGCSVLKKYYDLHAVSKQDIEDYFPLESYDTIKEFARTDIGGSIDLNKEEFFMYGSPDFENFIKSRHSVRNFSPNLVDEDRIRKAVRLANHCPSACNRQSSKVYLVNDRDKVQKILNIQKGALSTAEDIHQLLVVVSDRAFFFTSGERNQLFIDGGIFLESLILCLHNESIASCPLHWSLNRWHDKKIKRLINLSESQKVIALLAIGNPKEKIKVPASHRKPVGELLLVKN